MEVRGKMALPITPTPQLNVKESRKFLEKVRIGLENPVGPKPTPRIDGVIKKILDDARKSRRQS